MPKVYKNYTEMFKDINNGIERAMESVAEIVRDIWRDLVEEKFYSVYEPSTYIRTFESIDAITSFPVTKVGGNYMVEISYDESKLITRRPASGGDWGVHTSPSEQGGFIEWGWEMPNGQFRQGAHAIEEMMRYVKSNDFVALFKNEMRKLGYTFK